MQGRSRSRSPSKSRSKSRSKSPNKEVTSAEGANSQTLDVTKQQKIKQIITSVANHPEKNRTENDESLENVHDDRIVEGFESLGKATEPATKWPATKWTVIRKEGATANRIIEEGGDNPEVFSLTQENALKQWGKSGYGKKSWYSQWREVRCVAADGFS
ncbi:MAG: hypothetical protein ACRD68_18710, partial [Pyrinomonadaceae bacterium]